MRRIPKNRSLLVWLIYWISCSILLSSSSTVEGNIKKYRISKRSCENYESNLDILSTGRSWDKLKLWVNTIHWIAQWVPITHHFSYWNPNILWETGLESLIWLIMFHWKWEFKNAFDECSEHGIVTIQYSCGSMIKKIVTIWLSKFVIEIWYVPYMCMTYVTIHM